MKQVYNRLTVEEHISKPDNIEKYQSWNSSDWVRCTCECGTEVLAPFNAVQKGYIKSCGCLRAQSAASTLEECRDSTHSAINLEYNDEVHNIAEWSRITGIPRTTILYRLSKEMPIEKVLERKENEQDSSNAQCD